MKSPKAWKRDWGNWRKNRYTSDHSTVKIHKNASKSPGDPRKHAVTHSIKELTVTTGVNYFERELNFYYYYYYYYL